MDTTDQLQGIDLTVESGSFPLPEGFPTGSRSWRCVLTLEDREMIVPFFTGPAYSPNLDRGAIVESLCSDASIASDPAEMYAIGMSESLVAATIEQSDEFRRFLGDRFDDVMFGLDNGEEG